jgi:LacI family transcriptional regulator
MAIARNNDRRNGRPTVREIAALAGVSPATVSRVINGRPEVSEAIRDSVLRVAREHGYSLDRAGRTGRTATVGRTGLVGVTLPIVHHSYFAVILDGATEACYEHGISIVLSPTLHKHDREASLLDRLAHGTTDGALLILPEESNAELSALSEAGFPFVIVDPHTPPDEQVPTVSAANASGATEAIEHLLMLGHRRIAAITGPRGWIATEERLRGYRGALGVAGVAPDPTLQIESDFSAEGGQRAAEQLLSLPEPPTAIFAFNDMLAIGAMRTARERGLVIPADISIVGFDDTIEASIAWPALTTVRQPLAEMGRMAVGQLMRLLQSRRIDAVHIELETRLVVRESSAPAP